VTISKVLRISIVEKSLDKSARESVKKSVEKNVKNKVLHFEKP